MVDEFDRIENFEVRDFDLNMLVTLAVDLRNDLIKRYPELDVTFIDEIVEMKIRDAGIRFAYEAVVKYEKERFEE